jgi:hypothetical protein
MNLSTADLRKYWTEFFQCRESIRDIIIYPHIKFWWYRTMLNFYPPLFIPYFGSHFENGHWKMSTGRHFQNGCHNTAKIQHCPISSKFDMWVDNDVPNWFPTLKNFYRSPFSKWPPQYRKNSTLSGHFENGNSRNFSMSGINSGHHYLPTYQILMISDNVEFLKYCGSHFENGDW